MNARPILIVFLLAGLLPANAASIPPSHAKIVVTSQNDSSIWEIDLASESLARRIAVGAGPAGLTTSMNGREIFITHPDGETIDVVDMARERVVRNMPYKGEPFGIAAGPEALYVSDWSKNIVVRLDPKTGTPIGSASVGKSPAGLVIDLTRHRLYVANRESDDVTVIDIVGFRAIGTIATGSSPFALALSPDGDRLYVANVRGNDLAVIDTAHLRCLATVPAGAMPYGVAVTPDGQSILITNQHGNTLTIIDAKSFAVIASIPVGRYPEGVLVSDGRAYVANWFSGDISIIDIARRREVTRIKVGDGPRYLARLSDPIGSP